MLAWLIKTILISLAIVLLGHNIYTFLLDRLTTEQTQTYVLKDIDKIEVNINDNKSIDSPVIPQIETKDMQDELTSFLLEKTELGV
tara:strand:- start:39 stop:296 length:258 start_codon:yes stop_codon:yes gene_type:complete